MTCNQCPGTGQDSFSLENEMLGICPFCLGNGIVEDTETAQKEQSEETE